MSVLKKTDFMKAEVKERPLYEEEQMKTGLVLEGGAMRGLFTAGVIDVLMENGIRFDGAIGVSAGAAFDQNEISALSKAGGSGLQTSCFVQ